MILYAGILLSMTLLGSVASLFLKRASISKNIKALILNYNLYAGGFLYLTAALLNIYILRYVDFSIVLPLTSITYIWTMCLSYLFLKEKITWKKILGVSLIFIGAVFVSMR